MARIVRSFAAVGTALSAKQSTARANASRDGKASSATKVKKFTETEIPIYNSTFLR